MNRMKTGWDHEPGIAMTGKANGLVHRSRGQSPRNQPPNFPRPERAIQNIGEANHLEVHGQEA